MQYRATTTIDAPADAVWAVLTDVAAWPGWEPNVTRVDGAVADGASLTVHTRLSDRAFPVRVTALDAPNTMEWTGGMPLGLFRGVRRFTLTESDGRTTVDVQERFSGPLLFLMRRAMPDLQPSFDAFVAALRTRTESAQPG